MTAKSDARPAALRSLSKEEFEKLEPLTDESIRNAIAEGEKERAIAEAATKAPVLEPNLRFRA